MADKAQIKLATSILSSDFARLGEQVAEATRAGADYIHVDIMDGHFVPSLTWGPGTVEALKGWTHLPLDVHLMIQQPERHIASFLDAGADTEARDRGCVFSPVAQIYYRRLFLKSELSAPPACGTILEHF